MKTINLPGLFVALSLFLYPSEHPLAKDFQYSNSSILKQAIMEGRPLGPPSAGGALLDAVDKGYFDVALLELKKPGVIKKNGPDALNFAIREGNHDMVAFLLAAGVSPNDPANGWFPAGAAAFKGDVDVLCNMLDYDVDVSKRNDRVGNLQMALSKMHIEVAVLLMAEGYKIKPDERLHMEYFWNHRGLQKLTNFILNVKPNPQLVQQMCMGSDSGVN